MELTVRLPPKRLTMDFTLGRSASARGPSKAKLSAANWKPRTHEPNRPATMASRAWRLRAARLKSAVEATALALRHVLITSLAKAKPRKAPSNAKTCQPSRSATQTLTSNCRKRPSCLNNTMPWNTSITANRSTLPSVLIMSQ